MQRSDHFLKSFFFSLKYYLYLEQNQKYVVDVLYIHHIHHPKKIAIFNFHLRQKMYLQNVGCVEWVGRTKSNQRTTVVHAKYIYFIEIFKKLFTKLAFYSRLS